MAEKMNVSANKNRRKSRKLSVMSWDSFKTAFSRRFSRKQSSGSIYHQSATVNSVRSLILAQFDGDTNRGNQIHASDLERIKSNDSHVQRFIDYQWSLKGAGKIVTDQEVLDHILKVLTWRKSYGINDLKASDFPIEILKTQVFLIGYSSNGNVICLFKINKYYKVKNWSDLIIKAIVYCFDIVQSKMEEDAKMIGILDLSGCGYRNMDFDLVTELCPILLNQFPSVVSNIFFIDLPWIASPVLKGLKAFLPRPAAELMVSVSRKAIGKYLIPDDLPTYLGGHVHMDIGLNGIEVNEEMPNIEEVGKRLNLSTDSIAQFQAMVKQAS